MRLTTFSFDFLATKFFFLVSILLYRISLDASYFLAVYPAFSYAGFELDISPIPYLISWLGGLIFYPLISVKVTRLSELVLLIAYLGLILPMSSYYGITGLPLYPFAISVLAFLIFHALTREFFTDFIPSPVKLIQGGLLAKLLSCGLVFFLVAWYFYSGAFSFFNLDITRVYEFRGSSAEVANIGFLSYLNGWTYQVFNLFLISVFLLEKRFLLVFLFFAIQVFFFGVTGHKSLLFYPFLLFGVWFYFKQSSRIWWLPLLLAGVVFFSVVFYCALNNVWPISLFVRRVLFVPADLTYDYFSFFSESDFVLWSNSILSSFLEYPYEHSVPKLIGEYNGSGAGANNGFIASGYGHAGVLGVVFYTVVFSFLVMILEKFTQELPLWFSIAITIIPIRSAIVSSDLFTVILTHGLLVTVILIALYRHHRYCKRNFDLGTVS